MKRRALFRPMKFESEDMSMRHGLRSTGKSVREFVKRLSGKTVIVILATLIGCIAVLGVRAYSRSPAVLTEATGLRPALASESGTRGHASGQATVKPRLTDSVLVTITPGGFDRDQITAPAVPFFILVENRSGLEEVSLQLDRVAGPRLRQVTVPQERLDWSDLVDLSPGEYVLSEANHPSWLCRITITSK